MTVEKRPDFLSTEALNESERAKYYSKATVGERGFKWYAERLGFSVEDLRGKFVLDIGSSDKERFSKEVAEQGITVVSMNPELADKRIRRLLLKNKGVNWKGQRWSKKSVAGIVQELPFRENAFDAAVAYYSVPVYLPPFESEYRAALVEVLRVLKPGGAAYFFPIFERLKESKIFESIRKDLAASAEITLEPVGEDLETGEVLSRLIIRKTA